MSDEAIAAFIENCKSQKPQALEKLRERINYESKKSSERELNAMKDMFQFVSQPNVIVATRSEFCGGSESEIGKYEEGDSAFTAFGVIETLKILDKRTVLAQFKCSKAIIEGVDASQIPLGKWKSTYLLRCAGTRKVPAAIGNEEIPVYDAISGEGFPKDIIIW